MIFSSRNHHSPLSFFRKAGIIALLLTATFFTNNGECSVSAENPSPAKASGDLRVLHVRGADSGDIPAQLKKYSNYLRRAGAQHWKLEEEKSVRLQGTQPLEVALPGKLGKAIISVDAKKVATVRFLDAKGKSLGKYRSSRFPLVIVNQRLKLKGQPYVFILDLPRKK